jgi:hypothetical protein
LVCFSQIFEVAKRSGIDSQLFFLWLVELAFYDFAHGQHAPRLPLWLWGGVE